MAVIQGIEFTVRGYTGNAERAIARLESSLKRLQSTASRGLGSSRVSSQVKSLSVHSRVFGNALGSLAAPLKHATKHVGEFGSKLGKIVAGFKRILFYRAIRSIIREVSEAFAEGVKHVYEWSKAVGGPVNSAGLTFAETMDDIATSLAYFKNSIGAAVAPLMNVLRPAIQAVTDAVIGLLNAINQLLARLTGQSGWIRATRRAEEYEEAVGGAGGAAKEALKYLAPFDELNVLPSQHTGGGGGGGLENDIGGLFEEMEEFENGISDFADRIRRAVESANWQELGTILGDKVNEIVASIPWAGIGEWIGEKINALFTTKYWTLETINFTALGESIAELINNALRKNTFSVIGASLVQKFTDLGDLIIGAIGEIDWGLVGESIGDGIRGAFDHMSGWLSGIDFSNLGFRLTGKLVNFMRMLDLGSVSESFSTTLKVFLEKADEFLTGIDFKEIGEAISTELDSFIKKLNLNDIAGSFIGVLTTAIEDAGNLIAGVKWGTLGYRLTAKLANFLRTLDLGSVAETFIGTLTTFLEGAWKFITSIDFTLIGESITTLLDGFIEKLNFDGVAETFIRVLTAAIQGAGNLIAGVDWGTLGYRLTVKLINFFRTLDLSKVADQFVETLVGAFNAIVGLGVKIADAIEDELDIDITCGIKHLLFDDKSGWTEEDWKEHLFRALWPVAGAAIGLMFGGVGGAILGAKVGIGVSLLIQYLSNIKDESGWDATAWVAKIYNALAVAGGVIGLFIHGPGGALLGATIGFGLKFVIKTIADFINNSGWTSDVWRAKLYNTLAVAGAVIGLRLGGVGGALFGATIGFGLGFAIVKIADFVDNSGLDENDWRVKLFNAIKNAAKAIGLSQSEESDAYSASADIDLSVGIQHIGDIVDNSGWTETKWQGEIYTVLLAAGGAAIGLHLGGLTGALLGASVGVGLSVYLKGIDESIRDDSGWSLNSWLLALKNVIGTVTGATLGFKVGGPGGAAFGMLLGLGIDVALNYISKEMKANDGLPTGEDWAKAIIAAMSPFAGAAIGFAVGGPGGALIGATIGISISWFITHVDPVDEFGDAEFWIERYGTDLPTINIPVNAAFDINDNFGVDSAYNWIKERLDNYDFRYAEDLLIKVPVGVEPNVPDDLKDRMTKIVSDNEWDLYVPVDLLPAGWETPAEWVTGKMSTDDVVEQPVSLGWSNGAFNGGGGSVYSDMFGAQRSNTVSYWVASRGGKELLQPVSLRQEKWSNVSNWVYQYSGGTVNKPVNLVKNNWTYISEWLKDPARSGGIVSKAVGLAKNGWSNVATWLKASPQYGGVVSKSVTLSTVMSTLAATVQTMLFVATWNSIKDKTVTLTVQLDQSAIDAWNSVVSKWNNNTPGRIYGELPYLSASYAGASKAVSNMSSGMVSSYNAMAAEDGNEDAMYMAFVRAMTDTGFGEVDVNVMLDGDNVYKNMVRRNRANTRMTGVNAFA